MCIRDRATYYAKLQDMPDSEYKVEILEDGPIKKIAVNGKVYEVDYNMGGDSIPVSYTHLDVYKRQGVSCVIVKEYYTPASQANHQSICRIL